MPISKTEECASTPRIVASLRVNDCKIFLDKNILLTYNRMDICYSISLKGCRENNEDKHCVIINSDNRNKSLAPINFFAVFDGHGGKFVSQYLFDHMPRNFLDKIDKFPYSREYIKSVFSDTQSNLKNLYKNESSQCGSTCLILIGYKSGCDEYINIFNVGDSRCILCHNNIAVPLTKDHKPMFPEEKRRLEKLGGKIYFDGSDYRIKELSVSRSFGDLDSEPFLTADPDIFRYKIDKSDKFIVLGCDGLYDCLSDTDIVNYILNECYDQDFKRRNNDDKIAKKLAELAIKKGSMDNITVIIIFFQN